MKKTTFLLLALFNVSSNLFSQSKFYKTYDTSQTANYGRSIIHYANKYFITGELVASNLNSQLIFNKYNDSTGEYISSKLVVDTSIKYYNSANCLINFQSSFYSCGSLNKQHNSTTFKTSGLVLKYNLEGDTVWTKLIPDADSLTERILYSIIYYNNHIYCTGVRAATVNNVYKQAATIIKLDTLGNIIWEKLLPTVYMRNVGFYLVAHNNKIYVSGNQYNSIDSIHSFSFNIDENGNESNYREYFKTNFSALITKVFNNGDYIVVGTSEFGPFERASGYLAKYNSSGVLIWEKEVMKFAHWNFGIANDIFEDTQGNLYFFCTGIDPYETLYNAASNYKFFILKTTANGDSLWMKRYSRDDANIYASDWLQNEDGGFTVCGSVNGPNIPGYWDAWLMRVDSNGCIDEFCTPVGIKEESFEWEDALSVYPNPANDFINFESNETINKIEISNAHGQVIENINGNSIDIYQLSTSNYKNGIYFYHITLANKTSIHGKFLIQH
jgi:hypothetical protein